MSNELNAILDFLMKPGVDYNMQKRQYGGVLFHQKMNAPLSAIVASAFFVVEMENVMIDAKGQFYNYWEAQIDPKNAWSTSPYPRTGEDILSVFKALSPVGHITVPFANILNHIGRLHIDIRKRSRVIFSPGVLGRNDILLKFRKEEDGVCRARNVKSPKPFIPMNGPFPADFGTRDQFYKCRILSEEADIVMVEVIDIYGRVRVGVKHSPQGFVPDNMNAINDLVGIPPELVMGINQVAPKSWLPLPTHLDCVMLCDLLRIFGILDTKFLDIFFSYDPNVPIIIKNKKESTFDPQINIAVATLNQNFGAQRR